MRLQQVLEDSSRKVEQRILAAMGLSSRRRVADGQAIDVPCIDLGAAQIVLLPGESFVGYQLMAQQLSPDSFVMAIGYGECWPGYIPTESAFQDGFQDVWLWAAPDRRHACGWRCSESWISRLMCRSRSCRLGTMIEQKKEE